MSMKNLEELFVHFLRDMYYAEKQVLKSLPKLARKADSNDLRKALETHQAETETQIANLEKVFEMLDLKVRGETCAAMDGILEEGQDIVTETTDADARDAGMIASAQAVEHYEITRYGTMVAWANELGRKDAARLLQANLDQEYAADRKLSELAEKRLNREAA